ncbi:MAG: hypothetical protein PHF00_03890 [Elusimicrobia bacterium]|nr:hypothetical protein [Elusimicrobiota bacterium]
MEEEDPPSRDNWEKIARAFLRPPLPPCRARTEAFTARVMARVEAGAEPRPRLLEALRWLVPALSLAAACALFVLWPAPEQSPAQMLLAADNGLPLARLMAKSDAEAVNDILALAMEER